MTEAIEANPTPPPRRWLPFVGILAVLLLIVWATWWIQKWFDRRGADTSAAPPETAPAAPALPTTNAIDAQLADFRRVNSVLREQVLALTDRVRVLQDQVQTSAGSGQPQQLPLALAEQWLELAQARLDLFADPSGAIRALQFADQALIRSRDPASASLRQTLMIEIAALQGSALADPTLAAAKLSAYAEAIRQWPRGVASAQAEGQSFFARYFSIRTKGRDIEPIPPSVEAIRAELLWARVLLARGDWLVLRDSLDRAQREIEAVFDPSAPPVREALDALQAISSQVDRTRGVQIGSALRELRALGHNLTPLPETRLPETRLPASPLPETPLPASPLPESPLPESPLPESPLPETPLPESPVPAASSGEANPSSDLDASTAGELPLPETPVESAPEPDDAQQPRNGFEGGVRP